MNNTHLSSRVGRLNLDWMDPDQSSEKENAAFQQAMMLAGGEFLEVKFCYLLVMGTIFRHLDAYMLPSLMILNFFSNC